MTDPSPELASGEDKWFLLRVADPGWRPSGTPDLRLGTRLGPIVTMTCSRDAIKELLKDPLVISIEESRPTGAQESAPPVDGPAAEAADVDALGFIRVADTHSDKAYKDEDHEDAEIQPLRERGANALVAVIDNGIDVLHAAFRNADGTSCIVAVWDQTDEGANAAPGLLSGRLHTDEDIARYIRDGRAPEHLANGRPHGTQVASIAVGRPHAGFPGGVAPAARLLVVIPKDDGPPGYSVSHLDALKFIDQKATELGLPVVVNVSQGMNAGAHDGLSSLERDFDEFCNSGRGDAAASWSSPRGTSATSVATPSSPFPPAVSTSSPGMFRQV